MLQILPARDPAEDHRLRDPPFLRPDREVDVRDDEADERDARHAVQHVRHAPRRVAEACTGSVAKNGVRTRTIMKSPVTTTARAAMTIAR